MTGSGAVPGGGCGDPGLCKHVHSVERSDLPELDPRVREEEHHYQRDYKRDGHGRSDLL